MLDIQFIRDNPAVVKEAIDKKRTGSPDLVDRILELDHSWRQAVTEHQELKTEANASAQQIGALMKSGQRDAAQKLIARNTEMKSRLAELESRERSLHANLNGLLYEIPNIPHPTVPVGRTEEDNQVVHEWGKHPSFSFTPRAHWDLIEQHALVDFDRGAKVSGAGFPFYRGQGARLQRSLVQFFLDTATRRGYTEIQPPLVINEDSARGTGQLPDKEDLMYEAKRDGLYLIPTAEVPVTNLHRDEIIPEEELPLKYCAYTPCFRREAGSHGKIVRGLNRLHQFDKVELVQFVHPERSYDALEALREDAEALLVALELPYRRLLMSTGDMGFTQAKKYDLEVWSPGQEQWLEVSSISNFESFQARRMNIRYRPDGGGKPVVLHTLNGSGLALPRIVAALLEHGQQADGSIVLPAALHPWTGFDTIGP
ncbi:MAG: serine--tRNA ligase [Bacteroidetes bacterium CG12_big_fil_rev_8_21_14_0_65_60_17]|nr:MAG: serine--tRNA ligase [Bacteroidetes bacterium CG12_big_fil_rev_8_21_14_0_65_60_17]